MKHCFLIRFLHPRAGALLLLILLCGCGQEKTYTGPEIATTWAEMTLKITKGTPGNSPTYASRCLGLPQPGGPSK